MRTRKLRSVRALVIVLALGGGAALTVVLIDRWSSTPDPDTGVLVDLADYDDLDDVAERVARSGDSPVVIVGSSDELAALFDSREASEVPATMTTAPDTTTTTSTTSSTTTTMAPEIEVIAIPELPENLPTLFVGVFGPDVASLRQLLVAAGNEAAAEGPEPEVFDEALDAVVIEVQEELGLAPDGVVGPQTWYAILTRAIELETERELDPTPTTSTSTSTTTSTTSTTTSSPPAAKGGQSSAMEQFADVETVLVVGPATPGQVGEQTGLDTVLDPEGALLWQRPTERTVTVPAVLFALAVGLAPVALAGGLMAGFGALSRRRSSNSGAPPAVPDGRVAVELAPSARIERPLPSRLKAATSIDRAGFVGHDGRLFPVVRVGGSRPAFPGEEVILINGGPGVQEA